jgi:hypothetical protein
MEDKIIIGYWYQDGGMTPEQTDRLAVGRKITLTLNQFSCWLEKLQFSL